MLLVGHSLRKQYSIGHLYPTRVIAVLQDVGDFTIHDCTHVPCLKWRKAYMQRSRITHKQIFEAAQLMR